MKITKISLRQNILEVIQNIKQINEWNWETHSDDDIIAESIYIILKDIEGRLK